MEQFCVLLGVRKGSMFAEQSSGPFSCDRGALGPWGQWEPDQSCPALPNKAEVSGVSTTGLLEGGEGPSGGSTGERWGQV